MFCISNLAFLHLWQLFLTKFIHPLHASTTQTSSLILYSALLHSSSMKRFSSSDSLGSMLYSPQEEKVKDNLVYSSEFQAMLDGLDDEGSTEESGHGIAKKRRLGLGQVQALEKIFEVDNKLDPERKVKVAQELGLQPRQVAIWFQNRRARWKTKQLERDYNVLKSEYENLQSSYKKVDQEKQKLVSELKALKEKLGGKTAELNHSNVKDTLLSSPTGASEQCHGFFNGVSTKPEMNISKKGLLNKFVAANSSEINELTENKDGSSDSDTSGLILNEQNNNNLSCHPQFSNLSAAMCLSSSILYPQFLNQTPQMIRDHQQQQQQHNGKIEELSLFSDLDECCRIFSVDQAPNLYWYDPRS